MRSVDRALLYLALSVGFQAQSSSLHGVAHVISLAIGICWLTGSFRQALITNRERRRRDA